MEQPYAEEISAAVERAKKKLPKDYSAVLPFMAKPTETKYHRTSPELAYKAMGEAIEGLTARDLRELAGWIKSWRRCDIHGRHIVQLVALHYAEDAERKRVQREIEERMNRLHPVIDFGAWKRCRRYKQRQTV